MKSDYDFNFSITGWFRNSLKGNSWKTQNNISFKWIRVKVSGSNLPILFNIFEDKIDLKIIESLKLGDLIKLIGYINYNHELKKFFLVPTKIELIAKNNEITKEEFKKLDIHVEKEEILKQQENNVDDEIVEMNWDKD